MRLYLVRHAEAEKSSRSLRDQDRALTARGREQAEWLGRQIAALSSSERPAVILTSPAVRARETALLMARHWGPEVREEPSLMVGEAVEAALALVRRETDDAAWREHGPPMLVGHNPTLEVLVSLLASGLDDDSSTVRTGEVVILDGPESGVVEGGCRLVGRLRCPD